MVLLKLLLVCVMVVWGDTFYLCSMPQWEAIQATLTGSYSNGEPHVLQRITEVSYDLNNTKIATTTYITQDGEEVKVKNIYNYQQKILYMIRGDSCSKRILDEPFRNSCIPKNFYMTWTKTFYGELSVEGDCLFTFEFQGTVNNLHHIIQTTYNGNPVLEVIYGVTNGVSVFTNSAYLNMTVGIKNPDVFTPPLSCMGVIPQMTDEGIPETLGLVTF